MLNILFVILEFQVMSKDLVSQEAKIIKYAQNLPNFNNNIISITDLGSGLNKKRFK